jgi:Rho GTPase-activating protein 1
VNKIDNPHTIACVFKQFFLKLKKPLMTFPLYDWVVQNKPQIESNMEVSVKMLFDSLPELNRTVLFFALGFLNKVITHQDHNLMTTYNMAVVFGPNFFRSEVLKMADLGYVTYIIP